jgi:hypothetical protein
VSRTGFDPHRRAIDPQHTGLELGRVQQVVDQAGEPVGGMRHDLQELALCLVCPRGPAVSRVLV